MNFCVREVLTHLGALILAVPHEVFQEKTSVDLVGTLGRGGCLIDVKSVLDTDAVTETGVPF